MNELPIKHLSFSSMKSLLSNPYMFYTQRILGIWDEFKGSPAMLIGKAFHLYVECTLTDRIDERDVLVKQLVISEFASPNFEASGKTEQDVIDEVMFCVQQWESSNIDLGEVIAIERKVEFAYVTKSKHKGPLNLVAIPDIVSKIDGKFQIFDWKTVSIVTSTEKENPDYILQSMFYYYAVLAEFGEAPERFTFLEVKKSGKGGVHPWVIDYKNYPHYFDIFDRLYIDVIRDLLTRKTWLPNFSGMWDKEQTWESYASRAI